MSFLKKILRAIAVVMAVIVVVVLICLAVLALGIYFGIWTASSQIIFGMTASQLAGWGIVIAVAATVVGLICDRDAFLRTVKKAASYAGGVLGAVVGGAASALWPLLIVGLIAYKAFSGDSGTTVIKEGRDVVPA